MWSDSRHLAEVGRGRHSEGRAGRVYVRTHIVESNRMAWFCSRASVDKVHRPPRSWFDVHEYPLFGVLARTKAICKAIPTGNTVKTITLLAFCGTAQKQEVKLNYHS